jgi:phosphate-selective porin OprO/OprP
MLMPKKRRLTAAIALAALAAPFASARAEDTAAEIRLLKARLKQLESKVAEQAKKEREIQKEVAARAMYAAPGAPQVCKDGPCEPVPMPPPVWVSFGNGLKVESFEKDFSFAIGGRIYVDGGVNTEPSTGPSGNTRFRRARLSVEGKAYKYWNYKFEYDFTGTGISGIRDAYIALKHPALAVVPFTKHPIALQVGNFKEPFGLEALASANNITFIERALSDVFNPFRHIGFAAGTYGDDWTAKVGVFGTALDEGSLVPFAEIPGRPAVFGPSIATGGGQQVDVTGRVTWAPIHTEDALIHIGGAGRYHKPNSATGTTAVGAQTATGADARMMLLGSSQANEWNILGGTLVGTPDLSCGPITYPATAPAVAGRCVSSVVSYNAELALAYGPLSLQGEYFGSHYSRNAGALAVAARATSGAGANSLGGTSLDFNGFYVYGSWFLTGESRAESYNIADLNGAILGAPKIKDPVSKGGWGAWEFAARYSQINLNDGGIQGGRQENVTVGLNWYPVKGFRFMANWINVVHLSAPWDRPYLNGSHPNIFLMRAQVNW